MHEIDLKLTEKQDFVVAVVKTEFTNVRSTLRIGRFVESDRESLP